MVWTNTLSRVGQWMEAQTLQFIKRIEDPEARFDLAVSDFKQTLKVGKRSIVLMQSKMIQIDNYEVKIKYNITVSRDKLRQQLKENRPRVAKVWSTSVAGLESLLKTCGTYQVDLENQLLIVEERILEAEAAIEAIEMFGEVEKMRIAVGQARVEMNEQFTGIKEKGVNLYEAWKGLVAKREDVEARAQALDELQESGLLPSVIEDVIQPEIGRADQILKEIEAEIRKAETEEIPEFPDRVPSEEYPRLIEEPPIQVVGSD